MSDRENREDTIKASKFHGKKDDDFTRWAMVMEAGLETIDLMGIVNGTETQPENAL